MNKTLIHISISDSYRSIFEEHEFDKRLTDEEINNLTKKLVNAIYEIKESSLINNCLPKIF